jgi:hypothetical protein
LRVFDNYQGTFWSFCELALSVQQIGRLSRTLSSFVVFYWRTDFLALALAIPELNALSDR